MADTTKWRKYRDSKALATAQHATEQASVRTALDEGDSKSKTSPVPFECPICGHNEYTPIVTWRSDDVIGPGNPGSVSAYSCSGCTVRFGDPERFSKKRREVNRGRAR